jgi:hypothetical protein
MRGGAERGVVVATAMTKNYLSLARTLASSLRRHHPDLAATVLLVDEATGFFDPNDEPFRVLQLSELEIPSRHRFLFQYTSQAATIALKPYLLRHLLDEGCEAALYVDADMLVLGDLGPLLESARRSAIVLTPHLVAPLAGEWRIARELNILVSGIYNGGVVGVSDTRAARSFLDWWGGRLWSHCRYSVPNGMHFDQRWLDLVPSLFEDVEIVHDPAYNVGHWRLPDAVVNSWRLMHFSGYSADEPWRVTSYSDRLAMAELGEAGRLFDQYREELLAAGWEQTKKWPYVWNQFSNGIPIPPVVRAIYLELGEQVEVFGDPFRTDAPGSFFNWLVEPAGEWSDENASVSRLWAEIHARRPDLQKVFPDPLSTDREGFLAWTAEAGRHEYDIPDQLAG